MKNLSRPAGILALLVLLLLSFPPAPRQAAAQQPFTGSKISGRLEMQVRQKNNYLQNGGTRPEGVIAPELKGKPAAEIATQKVFLHFRQPPTQSQLAELQGLGVKVYPDSWIPPVGKHPTGFVYAEMPVSRLPDLAAKDYLISLGTAEVKTRSKNNLAVQATGVNTVWNLGYYGAGVTVAVLDSGIDLTHPDLPAPMAVKDYSQFPLLDDTVANAVTGHGTHVTGIALGRGNLSGGLYKGVAPQANLVFLKIGNDTDASSTTAADVNAIKAAVDVYHARIITMSYGAWTDAHDGTDEDSQAVDYAVSRGAVFFAAAGNEAANAQHFSGTVAANSSTDFIQFYASSSGSTVLSFDLVWFDGIGVNRNLTLEFYDSSKAGPLTTDTSSQSESFRGTENRYFWLPGYSNSGYYYLKVKNNSGSDQSFHIYYDSSNNGDWGGATFTSPDPFYTLSSPAEADGAIAVGAYVTRTDWTDYKGGYHPTSQPLYGIAGWSSRGPRVDPGAPGKPNIVAPGSMVISTRDRYAPNTALGSDDAYIIDNDGAGLGPLNTGPADYIVMQGTSMATPHAAGVAALLLSKNPFLTPAQVRSYLEATAVDKGDTGRDNISGWGLINAAAALNKAPASPDINHDGVVNNADMSIVLSTMNTRAGDPGFNAAADLNGDGIVDIYDLVQIGLNFGRIL